MGEIQQKTDRNTWKHIPSKENIADILTKDAPPNTLGPGSTWQTGPSWLIKDRSTWPITEPNEGTTSEETFQKYVVKEKPLKLAKAFLSKNSAPEAEWYDRLLVRCSTLGKLIRCIAYVIRAAMFLSAKHIQQHGVAVSVGG